ncbi:DUF5682 family protein [Nocardiopsis suaedae]|uniref:DUF5682 family protein n=1 Tax=Nocardiopsis suaedae TaxID=3018444 RepID=A0ABT4TKW9_9ACTN|nr:DUF5682 family protein [Nocardiopsis suaedae]MDA2805334.1 DUF5682 family protein [Nocardiopsis suaedae]
MSTAPANGGAPAGAAPFSPLRERLREAAEEFAGAPGAAAGILAGMVDDVDRALREPVEVFPVAHHSPAAALAMARRLREKRPKAVFVELCEDLVPLLDELRNCKLPVALQAFASEPEGLPSAGGPLSVVAPVTEASAEYQAIAYALETPGVELVAVDRSVDLVFQWDAAREAGQGPDAGQDSGDGAAEAAGLHGGAVGVEIGDLRPRFADLEEHLLHRGRVRHWSEWWDQYVEQPLARADHDTYRQVMVAVGGLFRRLSPRDARLAVDEDRERHMWRRIREHLSATGTDPADTVFVCGAFHAASPVEEASSTAGDGGFTIPPPTGTGWLYGLIPSSNSAIEAQFSLAQGAVSVASATWAKHVSARSVRPFRLKGQKGAGAAGKRSAVPAAAGAAAGPTAPDPGRLSGFLSAPPELDPLDEAELRTWCVDLVRLARRNGYASSTADAIAVYETAVLLAGMRDRARPTPYDFQDAAVTCIEKDTVPGRRDVRRLCEILLGGDRVGSVGYHSMPPLAKDVADRLEPLGVDLGKRTVQRILVDLRAEPELEPASLLLWRLRRLLGAPVRPIAGACALGDRSVQESWDVSLGRDQRTLIELGYEGVTVEQVLEQRLRRAAWDPGATAASVLEAAEDALVLLDSPALVADLGRRAVEVLASERTADGAPEVLRRFRALVAHFRGTGAGLPAWCKEFVKAGYAHYCTLLPRAFAEEEAGVGQVAAMLSFLFSLESTALALGCDRDQLELAVAQSHPEDAAKVALLWAGRHRLGALAREELRARCAELLANPLVVPSYPRYLSGFAQALGPVPELAPFVVEAVSEAFARLPDRVLLPWLPVLVETLRKDAGTMMPALVREAGRTFPGKPGALDAWTPPWAREQAPAADGDAAAPSGGGGPAAELLDRHRASCDAVAAVLGADGAWSGPDAGAGGAASPAAGGAASLVERHPAAAAAVAALLEGRRVRT